MLLSTAMAAAFAVPGVAHAQLVRSGDLVDAIDSGGNPGQLNVVDVDANTTDMTVLSRVVVANWTRFNVPVNTTVNITNGTVEPTATLVNRVIGGNPSTIRGNINAQDVNLWLINQNGILFGDGATVNSASFFASTLDVSDADLFDFYEGTNLAGNGSGVLNFSGGLGNAVRTNSANVSFVTDGSLMFVSEQLTLNASFDAGTGHVSFVTAADVDVSFTPGSPLTYVVNAGTTVARGQTINGSVTGNNVDFAMFTAAGVTDAVLQVNALVNANTAVATDTGIRLIAGGDSPVLASIGGDMTSTGFVDIDLEDGSTLRATGTITGSAIDIDVSGEARVANLVTTAGDLSVTADAIDGDDFSATGGNIALAGTNGVATGGLTATGNIAATSSNSGTITLGDLDAGGGVNIQTLGRVTAGSITAGGNLAIGVLNFDFTADDPESVTLTGDVSAANIAISGRTGVVAQDLAATVGRIDITSGGNVTAGDVSAPGDIFFDASNTGRAAFGSLVSSGGRVAINGRIPDVIAITGLTQGTLVNLLSLGNMTTGNVVATNGNAALRSINGGLTAGNVGATNGAVTVRSATGTTAGNLSATGGSVIVESGGAITTGGISATSNGGPVQSITVTSTGGGDLNLGGLAADGNVTLNTLGRITAGGVTAGGALSVGATREPLSVTFTGNIDAGSVTIDSLGALVAQDILARTGAIDIDVGGTITTGDLEADLIALLGVGAITTGDIQTNQSLNIAATGGSLTVGNVAVRNAGATLSLSASGAGANVVAGNLRTNDGNILVSAANAITAGLVATSLAGSSTAGTIGLHAGQNITTGELVAGEDLLAVAGGNFTAGAITVGDDAIITATGSVTTGNILTTGLGSDANLPSFSGAAGASTLSFAAETQTGSNVAITAGGALSSGTITAQDNLTLNAASIATQALTAVNGSVDLTALGGITTASIAAGDAIAVESTNGGALNLGQLDAGAGITLDTTGSIGAAAVTAGGSLLVGGTLRPSQVNFTGNVSALDIGIGTNGALTALDLVSTGGLIDVNAGSINALAVESNGGAVSLVATGGITTVEITSAEGIIVESTAGGALDLGTLDAVQGITLDTAGSITTAGITAGGGLFVGQLLTPGAVTFTGDVTAESITLDALGNFNALDLTSTNGVIDLNARVIIAGNVDANGGDALLLGANRVQTSSISSTGNIDVEATNAGGLNLGTLDAGGTIALDTIGAITTGMITAGGALTVGQTLVPGAVTFTGDVTAESITLDALGALTALDLTSTGGVIDLDARSITAGAVSATGGGATLLARDFVTTSSIFATGGIDVDSTNGGALDLGTLDSGANITLDTTGSITIGMITAVGDLVVGALREPGTVNFTGNATARSITVDANLALTALDLTTTGGSIDIDARSITAGALTTVGGDVTLLARDGVTTASITSAGFIDVDSTNTGALNLGTLDAGAAIALDTTGSITTAGITADGALLVGQTRAPNAVTFLDDVTARSITIDTTGALEALNLASTNGTIDIGARSIQADNIAATGGDVVLLTTTFVNTDSIAATGLIDVDSTNSGNLDLGTLTAGGNISLDTLGEVTAGMTTSGGALTVGVARTPALITFTGDAVARSIRLLSRGAIAALDLEATSGNVEIEARTSVDTTSITASGLIDVDSTGGGALRLGTLNAGQGITLDTTGSITTAAVTAGGALVVGSVRKPSTVTFGGNARALSITVDANGAFSGQNLTSTGGVIDIDAGTINALALSATGGGATLLANGAVTTQSITATGAIDVDSTAGGVLNLGTLGSGAGITLDTTGNITTAGITAAGALVVGGLREPGTVTFTGDARALSITVDANGAFNGQNLTSTGGVIDIDAGTINALALAATGGGATLLANGGVTTQSITATGAIDVDSTAGGALNLGTLGSGAGITLDTTGNITTGMITATGDLVVGAVREPNNVTFTGNASARNITIDAAGAFTGQNMTATNGTIDVDARTIAAGVLAATGGNVRLLSVGNITTGAITATRVGMAGGTIDIDSTGTGTGAGALNLGALLADLGITLDTAGAIATGSVTARGGSVVANGASITTGSNAIAATGGDVVLRASGAITTGAVSATRANNAGGAIDVDSTAGGAVTHGAMTASQGITIDTAGSIATGAITAGGNLVVGGTTRGTTVTFGGTAQAANITVDASGLVTTQSLAAGTGNIDIEAGNLELASGTVAARNVVLTSFINGTIGLGTGTGTFQLTDTEIGRINADSLLINAGTGAVNMAGVTFGANTGRNTVSIATTGGITITGNITGTAGTGRSFRFGGTATGTGRASRIFSDINLANVNLGTNALELRGDAIVFGTSTLNTDTGPLSIANLVRNFVSNPNSILYDPRTATIANPVYLTAGNLTVTYGGSALFQNTAPRTGGNTFRGVVLAGGNTAVPVLRLDPGAQPSNGGAVQATNAFALFGSINGSDGLAAALLGDAVISVDGDTLLDASRINGCVIGSGADCVTTIVGNVVMTMPREVVSLLTAEDRLLVPFDPLVGTNNESLFSDVASGKECETRDANGVCVSN